MARGWRSGPSARWSASGPASPRATTRRRRGQKLAATLREYVDDATERAWMEPRLAALLGLEAAPAGRARGVRGRLPHPLRADLGARHRRPRLRGAPVGRPCPPRLHRDDHRPLAGAAHPRRDPVAPRPARTAADLGRRPAQLLEPPAGPARARRGRDAPRRPRPGAARPRPSRRSWSARRGSRSTRSRWSGCSWTRASCASATAATTSTASWARWPSRERWPGSSVRGSTGSRSPSAC